MDQRFIISIEFEPEAAFTLHSLQRSGGSTPSMGKFMDANTGEYWLGKSEVGYQENDSKLTACKEKIANDIYGYFGIRVPRLRISFQALAIEDKDALQTYREALRGTHAWHVMSRWLDRFDSYGYLPIFAGGDIHELSVMVEGQTRKLPERGLGHILAVAHWLNDIDVMSPSGGNVGYQLQVDEKGQLYAQSCKIDPGYAFYELEKPESYQITPTIQIATNAITNRPGSNFVRINDLSQRTQQEYFLTIKKIAALSDAQIADFFGHPNTQQVLGSASRLIRCLKSRRNGLAKLHEAALQAVQEMVPMTAPTAIPPILQRLYCQAKLQYETDVREKAAFYVPLDVTVSSHSEERIPMQTLWENFLGIRSFLSLTTQATTTVASTTASAAISSSASSAMASISVFATQSTTQQKTVLLLLGASGSGKSLSTQLLVQHCWQAFLQNPQHSPIPLRIELKQFSERTVGQCIINTLLDEYRYSPAEIQQLQHYPFVFILDGYDELAGQAKINLLQKHQATESQYGQWQAQFIISCRDSYFQGLDQNVFYPAQGLNGLDIRYLSSLTPAHQIDYLMCYKENAKKTLPDYKALLAEHPHLHELLGNPFLLRIFRDALPQWQVDHPEASLKDLTRYDLYTAFMKHWFASEALRLSMIQAKYLPDNLPERFLDFSLRLAFTMHVEKVDEVNIAQADQRRWEPFFSDQNEVIIEARAGCPLRRIGQSHYSFVHKSFLEYFVARCLWEALENQDLTMWNQRLLPETREIIQFLVERWKTHSSPTLEDRLWKWIDGSKGNKTQSVAAANAATLLNWAGVSFTGRDLEGVTLCGADLESAICGDTNFRYADLRGANFSRAYLAHANLTGANLTEVYWGEYPWLQLSESVSCVAYSSDGRYLAVGTRNEIQIFIDVEGTGAFKPAGEPLTGHTNRVMSVSFSPDGKILASGSEDNTIRLWDTCTRKILDAPLTGHTNRVMSVSFSPDGKILASGSGDRTIRLWDTCTRKALGKRLIGHASDVTSVNFSPDGKTLASGSGDCTIRLWDTCTRKALGEPLTGHTHNVGVVRSVSFSPDGKILASGSEDNTIRLWDTCTRKALGEPLTGHGSSVTSVSFSPDGKTLASGSGRDFTSITRDNNKKGDNTVRLWDIHSRKVLGEPLVGHTDGVTSVSFSPDGKTLTSSSWDNTIRLWDIHSRKVPDAPLTGHTDTVMSVSFSPDGKTLASGSGDNTIRLWDIRTRKALGDPLRGHTGIVCSVSFSPDGKTLASGSGDCTIRLWDTRTRKALGEPLKGYKGVRNVNFSPDGKTLASGSWDCTISLWDTCTRKALGEPLPGHAGSVTSVSFSPDGKTLASGLGSSIDFTSSSEANTVRLWDIHSRKVLGESLIGHTDGVTSVSFSPDGKTLASGSWDCTISLWDTCTRKALGEPLRGRAGSVTSVSFSPDGKTLASGSRGSTICLWDIHTQKPLGNPLIGHIGDIESVSFSPDGQTFASAGEDRLIFLWICCDKSQQGEPPVWVLQYCLGGRNKVLHLESAYFKGAILSDQHKALLRQRGATEEAPPISSALTLAPSSSAYRSVLSQPRATASNPHSIATMRTPLAPTTSLPAIPAPFQNVSSTVTATLSFERNVLKVVQNLQTAIQQSGKTLDPQAASSFTSTFLRAIRKGTLPALQASPEEHAIPTRWATWLTDAFEKDSTLKALLKNPHNSNRFELELLQENLPTLLQRYAVFESPPIPFSFQ